MSCDQTLDRGLTPEDIKDSLLDKTFLKKVGVFIVLMILFFSAGYIVAKERAFKDGYKVAVDVINKICSDDINLTTEQYTGVLQRLDNVNKD